MYTISSFKDYKNKSCATDFCECLKITQKIVINKAINKRTAGIA